MRHRQVAVAEPQDPRLGPFRVEFNAGRFGRDDEFRLRWDVFVDERHYLEVAALDRRERDEFDDWSAAFLLRDAETGALAACQRFVLPDWLPDGALTQAELLARTFGIPFSPSPRTAWAEVSRSTIAPQYRWGASLPHMPAMRAFKYASLALADALGRTTLFSVSDVRTAILTRRRMGFRLRQMSDPFEYHGPRALFAIDVDEVRASVPDGMQDVVRVLTVHARQAVAVGEPS